MGVAVYRDKEKGKRKKCKQIKQKQLGEKVGSEYSVA